MNAQTALAALSLAIRERLLGGGTAVLPGLGALSRAHVPARVEANPDGTRALLPPGETVRLSAPEGDPAPLAALVVRHLGAPQADPMAALATVLDHLEARLAATGEAPLAGLGTFERTSGGVRFLPETGLLAAFSRPLAGVPAVSQPPPPPAESLADLTPAAGGVLGVPVESAAEASEEMAVETTDDAPEPTTDEASTATPDPASPAVPDPAPVEAPEEASAPPADFQPVWPLPVPGPMDDETGADADEPSSPSAGDETPDEPALTPETGAEPRPEPWEDAAQTTDSIWSAPDPLPPPSLGEDDADLIEDADFQIVEPAPAEAAFTVVPDVEPAATPEAEAHSPLVETVFPPSGAPVPDPPPLVTPLADPTIAALDTAGDAGSSRGATRWIVTLVVLAVLAAIVAYWWVYLRDVEPLPTVPPVESVEAPPAAPSPAASEAPAAPDTMAAPMLLESPGGVATDVPTADAPAEDATTAAVEGTVAPPIAAPATRPAPVAGAPVAAAPGTAAPTVSRGLGRAPEAGQALLPPRLAGLPGSDATALASASAVEPTRGGYTWVVLSTPSADDAEALAARYRTSGYRTGVVQTSAGARPMWRVVVGQFESREHALRLRDRLPPQAPPDTWPLPLRR